MKTKIFGILALIVLSIPASAQEYIPMLKEGNQWNVMYAGSIEGIKPIWSKTYIYRLSGDTVIEGKIYLSIIQSTDKLQETWHTAGFLREDTDSMKVYFRENSNQPGQEGVLYDFSAAVGDTVVTILGKPTYNIVTGIDSVEIEGEYHKHMFLSSILVEDEFPKFLNEWIEGIGHIQGLLRKNVPPPCDPGSRLLAFKQNGETVYNPYSYDTDFIWWAVASEPVETASPVTLSVAGRTLHVAGAAGSYSVDVFSVDGKHLLHRKNGDGETDVQLSALPSGIYVVRVVSDKYNVSSKIRLN
ncbi:MAG: T9SS type A sorting domain-containing protein [Tannerella sp.]|jgi:hypothetical protein|nr:T9SS type A sorting domain-containing protein [Tannerella sp.]